MWRLLYKWATWTHPSKPKRWIVDRYFGRRNKFRNDRWVFGDPVTNAAVIDFAWTHIVRHVMVKGAASPDDPDLTDYWARRRQRVKPPLDIYTLRLLTRQDGRCVICGDHLLTRPARHRRRFARSRSACSKRSPNTPGSPPSSRCSSRATPGGR